MEMAYHKWIVRLTEEERQLLEDITRKDRTAARTIRRAQILLLGDENRTGGKKTAAEISDVLGVNPVTIHTVKKQYCEEGLQAVLTRKVRETPPTPPKITGEIEVRILAESCTPSPEGAARWSLRLLTERIIELEIVEDISYETVRKVLKKTKLNRT